ncbi:glycosyltransferase family 2 protein [Micavibrio aeruginosavorus]|uniref:glycosyltransferase family 2 protein n=1 Tax=Micavibrio aeruginosavorus TaxID=349221 RepID=UPI003F4AC88B
MMFSIITITRNDLAGLQATHKSVQSQTCTDYEWIVIDGASDDGTVAYLQNLSSHTPSSPHPTLPPLQGGRLGGGRENGPGGNAILWTSEPDAGLYDAMNKGLARATGDYIIFMNGGDQFADDNVLSNLSQLISMASTPPGFIYGDALETRPDGQMAYKAARPFIKVDLGMFTHHQAMVYARAIIGDMRYDTRYTIAADYKLTLQTLGATRAIYYVPAPFCIFANGGISQTRTALGRREQFDIRRELGVVGPIRNRVIKTLQMINMGVRRICPSFYWALKARRDNAAIRR